MEFDSPFMHLLVRDKILVGTYKQNLRISLEVAKAIVQARISFTGAEEMPALIDSKGVISMDKPAREYLASEEGTKGLSASAIVVNSTFSTFLGNFFLTVNRPRKMPVKIFTDVAAAEKWLKQFIL